MPQVRILLGAPICCRSRGERIRTSDLLRPRQARYQAALRPAKRARKYSISRLRARPPPGVPEPWRRHSRVAEYGDTLLGRRRASPSPGGGLRRVAEYGDTLLGRRRASPSPGGGLRRVAEYGDTLLVSRLRKGLQKSRRGSKWLSCARADRRQSCFSPTKSESCWS